MRIKAHHVAVRIEPICRVVASRNVLGYGDTVMGAWRFGYDDVNRLVTATGSFQPTPSNAAASTWAPNMCWAYDAFGNRLNQETSDTPFTQGDGSCSTTGTLYQNTWATYNAQNQVAQTSAPGSSQGLYYGVTTSSGTVRTPMSTTPKGASARRMGRGRVDGCK